MDVHSRHSNQIVFFALHVHAHTHPHRIMLCLADRVYIVSPREHLKTKEEYRLAERKVMNSSPHLVRLRITEERDYEAYRLDSKNTNGVYAKTVP